MYSDCEGCSGRRNYGPNPWSAPGTARAVDFVMGGCIMFWAVNEGASGGPNGNGQTTGANSVALANYAAAL